MKKFNFFPVLVVALFMFMGFESSAQTYVSVPDAIVLVKNTINQIPAATLGDAQSQDVYTNGMKSYIGTALLEEFKKGVQVAKALENVTAGVVVIQQRSQYKTEVLNFYKNLLLI